jgi:hypothetical protein
VPTGLQHPRLIVVAPGSFRDWMKAGGKLGGQHKMPRVVGKADAMRDLLAFMAPRAILDLGPA